MSFDQPPDGRRPKREIHLTWKQGLAVVVIVPCVIFGGIALLASAHRPVDPHARAAAPPRGPLSGVAVWELRVGFQVCVRSDLHRCTLTYGNPEGGTIAISLPLIRAVPSCDTQGTEANTTCAATAAVYSEEFARCMGAHGIALRQLAVVRDPRDPQLPRGRFELECAEGYRHGWFGRGDDDPR